MAEISTPPAISTILLNGDQARKPKEGVVGAGVTIKPGHLIEPVAGVGSYQYPHYKPHDTAGGNAQRTVCKEWGMPVDIPFSSSFKSGTIDDSFAAGDHIFAHECQPGDVVALWIKASGSAVGFEDYLESAGDGTVRKLASGVPLFKALEAVTPGASDSLIRAEALA